MLSRKCPKCGRVAQVRAERIFKATEKRITYSCGACGSTWTSSSRADRRPQKRKHTFFT